MTRDEISKKVVGLVTETLCVDKKLVLPGAKLEDGLGADSLDLVELIMGLEETFDIEIQDDVVERISTVADVIDLVTNLRVAR